MPREPADRWEHLHGPLAWPVGRASPLEPRWRPACDMYETIDAVVLVLELAGMRKEEIELSVSGRTVVVSGYRRRPAPRVRKQYHRLEILTGRFEVGFELPPHFDAARARASYQDGLLRVVLPRASNPPGRGSTIVLEWG